MGLFDLFFKKRNYKNKFNISQANENINNKTNNSPKHTSENNYKNILDKGIGDGPILKECGAIVLLNWCDNAPLNANYPQYFNYKYTITNPRTLHNDFVEHGLLEPPSEYDEFKAMKVDELKELLKMNNLKVSGKKSELINRLMNNNIQPNKSDILILSDDGKAFLEDKKLWIDFHKNASDSFSAREFKNEWDKQGKEATYNSIVWAIIQDKLSRAIKHKKYTTYRLLLHDIFKYFVRNNNAKEAVKTSIMICCIDLSGYSDHSNSYSYFLFLAPAYTNYISKHAEHYNPEIIKEIYYGLGLENGLIKLQKMQYFIELGINDLFQANLELSNISSK